jgi:hypothetical protein
MSKMSNRGFTMMMTLLLIAVGAAAGIGLSFVLKQAGST